MSNSMKLHHHENPDHVIEVAEDRAQAYLDQGWEPAKNKPKSD